MKKKKANLVIVGILFVVGLIFILYTGLRKSWVYYYTVEEFLSMNNKTFDSKIIRLSGPVLKESVKREGDVFYFKIGEPEKNLKIAYQGALPDMIYQKNAQVVVEGRFIPQENLFKATFLLTQCPSKYEASDTASP